MILLCGYGGDGRRVDEIEVKKQIIKICANKKVAIITNAKPKTQIQTCVEVGKFLTANNIQNKLFDLNNKDLSWQRFDVLYFGGGSPLKLMKEIEANGFSNFDWRKKDIIGQSAGAMILFEKFCDETSCGTKADIQEKDFKIFKGLGVIKGNKIFMPHANVMTDYMKNFVKCVEKNGLDILKLQDKEFMIF